MTHTIRQADQADIPKIASIVNAAFTLEPRLFAGQRTNDSEIREMMRLGVFLVSESGEGELVASVFIRHDVEGAYFGMLAVAPSMQRHGIGRAMVEAAEEYGRSIGAKLMSITVLSLREELLPYYDRLGYKIVGTAEFHPPPDRSLKAGLRCHKILLSKTL